MARSDSTTSELRPVRDTTEAAIPPTGPAFVFHPLRQLSAHLFSKSNNGTASPVPRPQSKKSTGLLSRSVSYVSSVNDSSQLGSPTVLDVKGLIAVGTEKGWVVVYSFGQEIKCVLGNDALGQSRPSTARST